MALKLKRFNERSSRMSNASIRPLTPRWLMRFMRLLRCFSL